MNNDDMLSLEQAKSMLERFGIDLNPADWQSQWPESQKDFTEGEFDRLFDPRRIEQVCRLLKMADEPVSALIASLPIFGRVPDLKPIAWHIRKIFLNKRGGRFPLVSGKTSQEAALLLAEVCVSAVPELLGKSDAAGYPRAVMIDTLQDIEVWMNDFRVKHGFWGLFDAQWLSNHFDLTLFRLGRLQYQANTYTGIDNVYRHKKDRMLMAFASPGAVFRADGQFDGADGVTDELGRWTAEFEDNGKVIRGYPINPRGFAERHEIVLPADEWMLVMRKGDPVLKVHIPAIGKMDFGLCEASFRSAADFFPKYLPKYEFRAFTSISWLFDSQWEKYLKPESNIVRVQRAFYLLPLENTDDSQAFSRVFGRRFDKLDDAPRDTSVQRAFITHMQAGGRWRNARCMLFPEDIGRNNGFYRRMFNKETK